MTLTTEQLNQIKADIAARKAMPEYGESVEGNIERLRVIGETRSHFSTETVEMLVRALEEKSRALADAERERDDWVEHSRKMEYRAIEAKEKLANREAQPVAYFAAAPDYGWDMFKNKEDAIATCQAEIDAYRDCRDDGWDDDVQRVCWGVVMQKAEGFDLQGLHTSNSNHTYQTCDYSLHPVTATAPPAPAVPDEMTGGIAMSKYKVKKSNYVQWVKGFNACRAAMLAAAPEGGNDA
ncbi:hypothetical protein ACTWOG_001657 [Serratia marcescens]